MNRSTDVIGGAAPRPEDDPLPIASVTEPSVPVGDISAATPVGVASRALGTFARRVGGVLLTQVTLFGLAFVTSILISRLLGPQLRGEYTTVIMLPGFLAAIGMFGLPAAVNYYTGRGNALPGLIRACAIFTVVLSIVLVGGAWLLVPWLHESVLKAADIDLLRLILLILPLGILTSFGGSILYGRQEVKNYNLIQLLGAVVMLAGVVIFVAYKRYGVNGAVASSVVVSVVTAVLVVAAVLRRAKQEEGQAKPATSLRDIASYGARLYPGTITGYFHYRADYFILQAVVASATLAGRMLGLYAVAVTMAEVVFYVPDSVSTLFLPRVAGATLEDSNRMVGRVGRFTTLLTVCVAVALIPAAFVAVYLILPKYVDSLPAFLVLLPGVVAFSVAKVLTSYVNGRGRPGLVSFGTAVALAVNVTLNILLIPVLGIVGASVASLVSYTLQAALAAWFAARLSGQRIWSLFVPGRAEIDLLVDTSRRAAFEAPLVGRLYARKEQQLVAGAERVRAELVGFGRSPLVLFVAAAMAVVAFAFATAGAHGAGGAYATTLRLLLRVFIAALAALLVLRPWPGLLAWLIAMPILNTAHPAVAVGDWQFLATTVLLISLAAGWALDRSANGLAAGVASAASRRRVAIVWAGALVVLALTAIATATSPNVPRALPIELHGLVEPVLVAAIVAAMRPTRKQALAFLVAFALSITLASAVNLGRAAIGGHLFFATVTERSELARWTFYNVGTYGTMVATALPIALAAVLFPFRRGTSWLWWAGVGCAVLMAVGLYFTFSKSAWIGAFAACAIVVLAAAGLRRRTIAVAVLVLVVSTFVVPWPSPALHALSPGLADAYDRAVELVQPRASSFDPGTSEGETSISERALAYEAALKMTVDHPLLGMGPGGFGPAYNAGAYKNPNAHYPLDSPHNFALELLAETGVPAAILVGLAFMAALGVAIRLWLEQSRLLGIALFASVVGFLATAILFGDDLYRPYRYMNSDIVMAAALVAIPLGIWVAGNVRLLGRGGRS